MKKVLYLSVLIGLVLTMKANAQESSVFPKGEVATNTDDFTGTIWLNLLHKSDNVFNFNVDVATYKPNSKLNWHIHPGGQILLITEGTGYYQEKGKDGKILHKGDVVKSAPGEEHWHASTSDDNFSYVSITPTEKGATEWTREVTDEEYQSMPKPKGKDHDEEQVIKELSKKKWEWMADKKVDSLDTLFDEKSVFVHMGGSWGKDAELNVIKNGKIWYKDAEIHSESVQVVGNTAILLSDITLLAEVGGKEVKNPFTVTETYVKDENKWRLGALSFTKLLEEEDE